MLDPKPVRRGDFPTLGGQRVTMAELRAFVIARDGCIARKHDPEHRCRNRWGAYETVTFMSRQEMISLEHVTGVHGHADGRKDDERHTVGLCYWLNGSGPVLASQELREYQRAYLRRRYPECNI